MSPASDEPGPPLRHSFIDDVQGFLIGAVLTSLGLAMMSTSGLMTGGTAGLAFLLHYGTGLNLGLSFWLLNLPFFFIALRHMGRVYTLKSLIAVGLLSAFVAGLPKVLRFADLDPRYAALAGGLLMGMGILAFIRHGASVGGVNLLAVYLQRRHGLSAGKLQAAVDALIVVMAFSLLGPLAVAYSILGAVTLGAVLALNHRPGRYMGV